MRLRLCEGLRLGLVRLVSDTFTHFAFCAPSALLPHHPDGNDPPTIGTRAASIDSTSEDCLRPSARGCTKNHALCGSVTLHAATNPLGKWRRHGDLAGKASTMSVVRGLL